MSIVINDAEFPDKETKAVVHKNRCDGCAFCIEICPKACLSLDEHPLLPGHRIVVVDEETCVGCGACQGTCPKEAIYIPGLSTDDLRKWVRKAIQESLKEQGLL